MKRIGLFLFAVVVMAAGCDSLRGMSAEKKFALAKECSIAGKKTYDALVASEYASFNCIFSAPEYHYSSRLNTCLVFAEGRYFATQPDIINGLTGDILQGYVINVFSNKVILDKKYRENGGPINDKIRKDFSAEKDKLFSE